MKDEVIGITRDRTDFWFTCVDSDVIRDEELSLTAKYISLYCVCSPGSVIAHAHTAMRP